MKLHSFSRIFSLVAVLALIFALTLAVSITANAQGSAQGGNELTITHEPINGDCEMVKFSWNKITDAKEYHIYKDGIHIANVPNEDNLTFIFKLPLDVEVVFTVEAISNSGAKLVSENYYCTPAHVEGNPVQENPVAPTCTEPGSYEDVVYCTVCNEKLSKTEKTVPANGHTYDEEFGAVTSAEPCKTPHILPGIRCSVCGDVESNPYDAELVDHTPGTVVKENIDPATCIKDGSYDDVVYCTVCDKELSRDENKIIPKLGHDEVAHDPQAPTCTEKGWNAYVTCSRCDYTTCVEIPALEHDEVAHDPQAPTCTEKGWNAYVTCSRCDYTTYVEILANGHTPAAAVEENRVEATCTADGSYDSVVYCTVCQAEVSRTTITLTSPGHTPAAAVEENRDPATCTEDGSYDSVVYCTVCQAEVSRTTVHEPKLGHLDDITLDREEPTCTETGLTAGVACSRCGVATTAQEVIPANGHTPAAAVEKDRVEPTCTVAGSYDIVVYCTVSECQAEVSRTTVPVAELGHLDDITLDRVEPTCTETGLTAGVACSRCEVATTAQEVISANGHTSGATVTEKEVPASCSKNGSYDSVVYCTVCGYQISRQNKVVDKLPHTPGSKETENSVEATCTEDGRYDTVVYCTVCHAEVSRSSHKVEAFGHSYLADENPEAILVYNYCERCGEKGEFIKAQIPPAHKDTVIKVAGVSACVIVVILCLVALARPATTTPWWRRRR